jgi:hypothetical protein
MKSNFGRARPIVRERASAVVVRDLLLRPQMYLRIAIASLCVSGVAFAEIEPTSPPAPAPRPLDPDDVGPKDPGTAVLLSVGGYLGAFVIATTAAVMVDPFDGRMPESGGPPAALIPLVLTGAALALVGPSFGPWYSGKIITTGLELRLTGAAVTAVGVAIALNGDPFSSGRADAGAVVATAGGLVFLTGAILDFCEARSDARAYNHAHRSLRVAPLMAPTADGHTSTGLAVGGAF